jgi:FMN-dependent NADH-azoreductase
MNRILMVVSSPRGAQSNSQRIAQLLIDDLVAADPEATVTVRDLASNPLPHVGESFVSGLYKSAEERTLEEADAIARSDALVDELIATDTIVIAAPMYNFGVPSTLKAWVDHVARAGRTFRYTEAGPKGLLANKRAILVVSRGGIYSKGPAAAMDFQESYLRGVLGFLGITDVQTIHVEGIGLGADAANQAIEQATIRAATIANELAERRVAVAA